MSTLPHVGFARRDWSDAMRRPAPMVCTRSLHPKYAVRPAALSADGALHCYEFRFDRTTWITTILHIAHLAGSRDEALTVEIAKWCEIKIRTTAQYHGWI